MNAVELSVQSLLWSTKVASILRKQSGTTPSVYCNPIIKNTENFGMSPCSWATATIWTFVVSLSVRLIFPWVRIWFLLEWIKNWATEFSKHYELYSYWFRAGGCPIFDRHGQLIGMTIASIPEMKGSLPVSALARVKEDLMASGQSLRAWIGLEVKENISGSGEHNVFVAELIAGGPAKADWERSDLWFVMFLFIISLLADSHF